MSNCSGAVSTRSRGYLPDDTRWQGFQIDEYDCVIVTPEGRRFSLKELDSWALRFDEYHALKRMYELDYVPVRSNVVTPLPFRGGRRVKEIQSDVVTKAKRKPSDFPSLYEERMAPLRAQFGKHPFHLLISSLFGRYPTGQSAWPLLPALRRLLERHFTHCHINCKQSCTHSLSFSCLLLSVVT
ncbi:phage protein [Photobacterium lipolyticum]|uniref:phage protein n=1 Tax=Photobacterium lipolyticum TaxID=266810 RepID=UPI001FEC74B6|nr:phage protein [Photobacterium lipolyticum]